MYAYFILCLINILCLQILLLGVSNTLCTGAHALCLSFNIGYTNFQKKEKNNGNSGLESPYIGENALNSISMAQAGLNRKLLSSVCHMTQAGY